MKKLLISFAALLMLLLCGCSSDNGGEAAAPGEASAAGGADIIEFGKKEDAKYLLQIDINPSVIVGYAENEEVVYIASNNEDGYELLEKHDAGKILGEPINAAIGSIMTAAHEDGYEAEGFDVAIRFVGDDKGDLEEITQITRQAVETCDFDINVMVEEENEIIYSAENGITEILGSDGDGGTHVCDVCNGAGMVVCDECDGAGETVVIVQREKEVRNDYVCEICGGKGWIDDGMHGGEKGNCDTCGGIEGKMPSGDFNAKAYDKIMVDEEEMRRCETCDGSCEIPCWQCNGSGSLD